MANIKTESLDKEPESHMVHLFLDETDVAIYESLFNERIKKHEALLKRVNETVYENIIKKESKMREHSDIIYRLKNLQAEFNEQSAW